MATTKQQQQWRARSKAGLIRRCPSCGKHLRQESKFVCQGCWLKTPAGRAYNRLKVQRYRQRCL